MRKVFLDTLPKQYNKIDWKNSIGYKVLFVYEDLQGYVEIIDYKSNNERLTISYNDKTIDIARSSFKSGNIGRLLGKRSKDFKIEKKKVFKDNKRNIMIIDREYRCDIKKCKIENQKWYKYHCNKCNNEGWIIEGSLLKGIGCPVCSGRTAKLGINTIWDTDRWMVHLGVSEEDAKKYKSQSSKRITVKCPDCGREKEMTISSIYNYKSIGCSCGDGKSYPEKFVINVLEQLKVNFETEYSPEWIGKKRYDFHIKDNDCIIETHGEQHYQESFVGIDENVRTLQQEQYNDKFKRETALKNGIKHYIELDCRESNLEYIKNSILNSELNDLYDLSNINWQQCAEFSNKNIAKEVCEYWNNKKEDETTVDIGNMFNLNKNTINSYLKRGARLGWCDYNAKEEMKKCGYKNGRKLGKKVEIFKEGESLGVFESCRELERQSEGLFGVKLSQQNISKVCNNIKLKYKGYTFKYI